MSDERIETALIIEDPRLVARLINLAHRCTCVAERVLLERRADNRYDASFTFTGPALSLRRLHAYVGRTARDEGAIVA